jgi:hypothetical protein
MPSVSTTTLQSIVDSSRVYRELVPQSEAAGWTQEPALSIGNDVMQKILAQTLNWKWNRAYVPPFLTVALQQDYCTNITDLGWLEQGWRVDINNSANPNAPKPVYAMEAVRDLELTSYQSSPFNLSYVPNYLAQMGAWTPNTPIIGGYGVAQTPASPIQQFIDPSGNILFIDSGRLGLSINSPGFINGPVTLPGYNPYGVTGSTIPNAGSNPSPGTQVTDGTVTWTVANPNGYTIRLAPLPAFSGIVWFIQPVYQKKPPTLTSLQNTLAPIPDELAYVFREGFMAMCYEHAGSRMAAAKYAKWEESLFTALRAGDRERDSAIMYPSEGLGGGPLPYNIPLGPGYPYMPGGPY